MRKLPLFFTLILLLTTSFRIYADNNLNDWTDWVRQKHTDIQCPWDTQEKSSRFCVWPGELNMAFVKKGLSFTFAIDIYSDHALVQLPGNQQYWPSGVTLNNQTAAVVEKKGIPYISLPAGQHQIKGQFQWDKKPASLRVPANIAFVKLTESGNALAIDRRGSKLIFTQKPSSSTKRERDGLHVEVYRLLQDGVPLTLQTRIKLSVSGKPREITLGTALLPETELTHLYSHLPARVESNGNIRVQVVAGEHSLQLHSRLP